MYIGNLESIQEALGNLGKFGQSLGQGLGEFWDVCENEIRLQKSLFHTLQRLWVKFEKIWQNFGILGESLGKNDKILGT